jgi:RNA polymerase sigma-70 factor (ECF subfamily)
MPPVVVKSVPQSGDLTVDPALSEIRVIFSKEMKTNNMWSWVMVTEATFPKIVGKSHFLDDMRTCVLPVKLEPGTSYVIWVNSESHNSFRDQANRPAVPYLLVFQTR